MSYDRRKSLLEELMMDILQRHKTPMRLADIVATIKAEHPEATTGKTPVNSLYSIIYRTEKRRQERGQEVLFIKEYIKGDCFYSLNPNRSNKK
ncbi:MAG: hypothetical protein ACXV8Q_00365 [Methylobacter sp.]